MDAITLKVTPQVLVAKSSELSAEKNQISAIMEEAKMKMAGLTGTWQSQASDEFQSRFRQIHGDIDEMLNAVAEYVKDLSEAGAVYERAEQAVKTTVQSTQLGGVFKN